MRTRYIICSIAVLYIANCLLNDNNKTIKITPLGKLEAKEIDKILPVVNNDENLTITTTTVEPTLTPQQKDYCNLKQLNTDIPLDGDVKIFSGTYGPTEDIATYYWVYSPDCPENYYSIIHVGYDGEVKKRFIANIPALQSSA